MVPDVILLTSLPSRSCPPHLSCKHSSKTDYSEFQDSDGSSEPGAGALLGTDPVGLSGSHPREVSPGSVPREGCHSSRTRLKVGQGRQGPGRGGPGKPPQATSSSALLCTSSRGSHVL